MARKSDEDRGEEEKEDEEEKEPPEESGASGMRDAETVREGSDADGLPDMLELIDAIEEAGEDATALVGVLKKIEQRIRASPDDRDLLSDFEGIAQICKVLAGPTFQWRGEVMLAFCRLAPEMCRKSMVNRVGLREGGFVAAAVESLRAAVASGDDVMATAASAALAATCTANDENKRAAAQLPDEGNSVPETPGGMTLLLEALGKFPESTQLQIEAISALHALMTDDDTRTVDCDASAVRNRTVALSDEGFPVFCVAVERALTLADGIDKPSWRLQEKALLLLRELARRQDAIETLALDAKLLQRVLAAVEATDARVVRASFAVLRSFVVIESVRDEIALLSDGAKQCLKAVQRHITIPIVCEQGFGLFANLTMRKSPIATLLHEAEPSVVALGLSAWQRHRDRPDVARSVVHTWRNVAIQDDAASSEVKESGIFQEVRSLVQEHEGEARWHKAVDIARQLLREFRADEGMLKKAVYNQYY